MQKTINNIIFLTVATLLSVFVIPSNMTLAFGFLCGWVYRLLQAKGYIW